MATDPDYGAAVDRVLSNRTTQLKLAVNNGMAAAPSPDLEAELRKAADATGVPLDSARSDPTYVKQQAQVQGLGLDAMPQTNPVTAQWLADENNAAIAHDDVPNLLSIEGLLRTPQDMKAAFSGELFKGIASTFSGAGSMLDAYTRMGVRQFQAGLQGDEGEPGDPASRLDKIEPPEPVNFDPGFKNATNVVAKPVTNLGNQIKQGVPKNPATAVAGFAGSITPALGAAVANPVLGAGVFASQGADQVQQDAEAKGVAGTEKADYGVLGNAGFQAALGSFGVEGKLADLVPTLKTPIADFLAKGAVKAAAGAGTGAAMAVGQNAIEQATVDPNQDLTQGLGENAGIMALMAMVAHGIHGAAGLADARTQDAATATRNADVLDNLAAAAQQSKLRARSPDDFKGFVRDAAENGPVSDVYVDANAFAQAMATPEGQRALQAMPDVASQLEVAQASSQDVKIPIDDFATHVAGTPELYNQLADQLKTDPEGMTRSEAADATAQQVENLKADFERVLSEKQNDEAFQQSSYAVRDAMFTQLQDAGRFTKDVNAKYADLAAKTYAVQAARLGITPEELHAQFPLKITAGNGSVVGGLDQAPTFEMRPRAVGAPGELGRTAREAEIGGATISYSAVQGGIHIDAVHVEPGDRQEGRARRALEAMARQADQTGTRLFLTAEPLGEGGPGKTALKKFYKSLGFVDNTGKNKVFDEPMAGMVREPKVFKQGDEKAPEGWDVAGERPRDEVVAEMRANPHSKGTFNPNTLTIALNKNADLSTFLHEMGHFHLEMLADLASRDGGPQEIKDDMSTVLHWFDPSLTLDKWRNMSLDEQRPFHEQFARGFETYLLEGKAPSLSLKRVFQRFSSWLVNIYRHSDALAAHMSDDVRGVMNRMLATRDEIAQAESVRGFSNPFIERPAGITDEEWRHLNELATDATLDAQSTLQARSLRDMKWLEGAKAREIRKLQREAAAQRKAVRDEVTAEVNAEPINQARRFLKHGEINGEPVEGATKLDIDAVKDLFPHIPEGDIVKALGTGKYGMLAKDGIHPDVAADMFGYSSGQGLVHHLLADEDPKAKIAGVTDQRMLERYGDLVDPQSMSRAADEAIHNDARIRFMASAVTALDKSLGDRNVLLKSTKALAAQVIGRQRVGDLRPDLYTAAEARAGKAVMKAMKTGDLAAAGEEMRKQLFNAQAAKAAIEARDDIRKAEAFFTKILAAKDDSVSKSRNMDLVNAARAVLSSFGYERAKNDPAAYMNMVKDYDPVLYGDIMPYVEAAIADAPKSGDVRDITMDQFRTLRETVGQIYEMAKRSQQVRREGKLEDLADIVKETMSDLPEGAGPYAATGVKSAPTKTDEIKTGIMGAVALLRRVEDWTLLKGRNFHRNLFQPLSDASLEFRQLSAKYRGQLLENLKAISKDLTPTRIEAPELNYTFGAGAGGGGMAELLGALRHTGNDSNFEKLLIGRGWGEYRPDGSLNTDAWDAFLARMHNDGVLQKRHWDYVQSEWNLHEEIKPLVQKAHREVYGRYFDEVEARPIETPFGKYDGGYVPATTDPRLVDEALMRQDADAMLGGASGSFMFPTPASGFTKARDANYAKALALDLTMAGQQVDAALKFATLAAPVRDVLRVLKNRELATKLKGYDPTAASDLLLPWLRRTATQTTSVPTSGKGGRLIDGAMSVVRRRAVMAMMFGNLANTPLHVTGLFPAALRAGKGNVLEAAFRYMRSPNAMAENVASASPFMADRATNHMHEMADAVRDIVKDPGLLAKVENWSIKHTFFLQHAVWNAVDQITWSAAYNKAMQRGEADPVRYADSVVRTTIGSHNAVDVSKFEAGPAWAKALTTFSGFFINQANTVGTEFAKAAAAKQVGRGLEVYVLGVMAPAVIGKLLTSAARGQVGNNPDESPWHEAIDMLLGSQVEYAAGAIPVIGPMAKAYLDRATGKTSDTDITPTPIAPVAAAALGAPMDVYDLTQGKGSASKTVRDAGTLVTMLTGIPATLVTRPLSYAAGVGAGQITPTDPVDATRGFLTGSASPASRTR